MPDIDPDDTVPHRQWLSGETLRAWRGCRGGIRPHISPRKDQYAELAADYHWLYTDDMLREGSDADIPLVEKFLGDVTPGGDILDAACGIGVGAAALARRGFRLAASDGSPSMVEQARRRLTPSGVETREMAWADLGGWGRSFDAVLCLGNSFVHADTPLSRRAALTGMRSVLRDGGVLLVDSRNWARLHEQGSSTWVADEVVRRDGLVCVRVYVWRIPKAWDAPHVAEVSFVLVDGDRAVTRTYPISYRPFGRTELEQAILGAGFEIVETDFDADEDFYRIWARKA